MSDPSPVVVRRSRKWRLSLGALTAIIAGVIVAGSVGQRPPPIQLPVPNGYDDLVKAGSLVKGAWPGQGDLARAQLGEIRGFLVANRPSLALARVGLGRGCLMPMENTQAGFEKHMDAIS